MDINVSLPTESYAIGKVNTIFLLGWWDLHSDQKQDWSVGQWVGRPVRPPRTLQRVPRQARGDQYHWAILLLTRPNRTQDHSSKVEEEDFSPAHPLGQTVGRVFTPVLIINVARNSKTQVASQREKGFRIVTGRWLVEGNPQVVFQMLKFLSKLNQGISNCCKMRPTQVILFDVGSAAVKMNEWKQEL